MTEKTGLYYNRCHKVCGTTNCGLVNISECPYLKDPRNVKQISHREAMRQASRIRG